MFQLCDQWWQIRKTMAESQWADLSGDLLKGVLEQLPTTQWADVREVRPRPSGCLHFLAVCRQTAHTAGAAGMQAVERRCGFLRRPYHACVHISAVVSSPVDPARP